MRHSNRDTSGKQFSAMLSVSSLQRGVLPILLLLQFCDCSSNGAVSAGISVATVRQIEAVPAASHCVVVLDNTEVIKEVGTIWASSEDPCALHACEADSSGSAHETISSVDCDQFYCDIDSELRAQEGTCCGECVRTKCHFNGTLYEVGQVWQNKNDCTLLECAQLSDGQPMINAYRKSCPSLPPDCAPEHVYVENCCHFCRSSTKPKQMPMPRNDHAETEDIWTEEYYRNHPCVRVCQPNETPKTCHYNFVVEWYETLSKACYDCPQNVSDCERPHCIFGDGIPRSVMVVNRMMPGPSIEVCENDMIVVDVRNELLGESTTIHWHGMHQKHTPYMDGVPHISQCPISPHASFRYAFRAENAGSHFWHSHTGMQRGDGVFGALIIRRPRAFEPHGHLYDFDLSEHKMILQDWVHVTGISMFASHHHSRGDNKPINLLINGRGRFYKQIWDLEKAAQARAAVGDVNIQIPKVALHENVTRQTSTVVPPTETESIHPNTEAPIDDVDFLHPLESAGRLSMQNKESNEISRLARLAPTKATVSFNHTQNSLTKHVAETVAPIESATASPNKFSKISVRNSAAHSTANATHAPGTTATPHHSLTKRSATHFEVPLHQIPQQIYRVRRGFRFRFRIINAEFLNCPIQVSIDNHTLTAINSDGYDFEAVDVGSIVTYAGERFDFVVHANQPIGNYWIRLKGLMDCSELFTSAFQVAILRYEGAPEVEPVGELGYHHKAAGIVLNVMNRGPGNVDSLTIAELNGLQSYDTVPGIDRDALKPVADYKFFVYYDFYAKDNPVFHPAGLYGFNDTSSKTNRLFTPQLNHISLKFPSVALLPARNEVDDSLFCNETSLQEQGIDCRKQFCHCHHVLQVPLNAIVELIVIDEGFTFDANHPFHLHGNAFRVVGLERLGPNVTVEMVKQLDRYNLLKRNLIRPPVKDTVTIPDGGYTIIRFEASNSGFWLFHCHIEFHAEIGMALIIKVGDNDQMLPVPKNFPSCNDYLPALGDNEANNNGQSSQPTVATTAETDHSNAASSWCSSRLPQLLILLLPTFKSIFKMS